MDNDDFPESSEGGGEFSEIGRVYLSNFSFVGGLKYRIDPHAPRR